MRRIHLAIYREVLPPMLITLVVLTFVVFTREFGRLVELLIRKNADFLIVAQAVAYLLPSILIFTLPFSFLIGALIGFSRMSSESEIVAIRAGGISVLQLLRPVLKLGIVVAILTSILTLHLLPAGNWGLRQLRHELRTLPVHAEIRPRVFYENFPGLVLYLEDVDPQTDAWKGVFVADSTDPDVERIILAQRGFPVLAPDTRQLQLHLVGGTIYESPDLEEVETFSRFRTLDIPIPMEFESADFERDKRQEDKSLQDLLEDVQGADAEVRHSSLVELNRRISLPLASLTFALLGLAFGVRSHRGGRGYGFVIGMVLAFGYYILFATGSTLSLNRVLPVAVGVWGANLLTASVAVAALRLARKESDWAHRLSNVPAAVRVCEAVRRLRAGLKRRFLDLISRVRRRFWELPSIRLQIARVIDLYIARIFFFYLLITTLVCICLFYLFTFFELINDLYAHNIGYGMLFDYYFFLLPHILMMLVPIAILIATLTAFSTLENTNQVTALKACGISVYRLAAPVFILALALSGAIFILQEHVLPYANQQQDNLRNVIKGRPIQTTQPGRNWIFGEESRLYHYSLFHSDRRLFAGLSVYTLDVSGNQLFRHVFAQRASWDPSREGWHLENGWIRDFTNGGFQVFEEEFLVVPEGPAYFEEGVKSSSKMALTELRDYIDDLQRGGFEVDYLRTELHKKVSFPLVNFIMAVIAIPFSLTIGRRGALYGIAVGIGIGIAYWGAFGVSDVLGASGMLAPMLAAWGPNILFGSAALLLLSWIRT